MYQQFFNFNTAPFSIAPDPHFIYMSEHHQEGLAHLLYGINQGGGFVALTGEVGTGKTTLCHCLLQQLPDNVDIALVLNPKLNTIELLTTICDELHIPVDQDTQSLKILIDNLNQYLLAAHAKGNQTVLVIDEAQNLSLDVLEQVRLLTNLETSKTKLLQIILLGQPELKQLLDKPELRQLNQRITARYHLIALSYPDTKKYIEHRLKISGGNSHIFKRRAIKKIYSLSKGIPRLVNIICDRALLGAYVNDNKFVNVKIINQAAKEVFNSDKKPRGINFKTFLLSIFMAAALGSGLYLIQKKRQTLTQLVYPEKPLIKPIKKITLPIPVISLKKKDPTIEALDFNSSLKKYGTSLDTALIKLAKLWGQEFTTNIECEALETTELHCLLAKSSWDNLVSLNRPVIMEFNDIESEKVYALLIGINEGNPVFFIDKKQHFPIDEVLTQWNGHYLLLWQPPIPTVTAVLPNTSSHAVLWIKNQIFTGRKDYIATTNSTLFDKSLKKEIINFQKNKRLIPDGIVGPKTFIHLNNIDPHNTSPKLKLID